MICYAAASGPARERLRRVIEMHLPKDQIMVCHSLGELYDRLGQPTGEGVIVVLLVSSTQELSEILLLQEMLLGRRVILILPDRTKETTTRGHRLRPRFITYTRSDYLDVSVVLGRMLQRDAVLAAG